ncbi:MAG: hypothetical protein NC324_01155 [Bacteroides sp.]|nr:hypothetical protein [Bacteroides sp.]
MRLCKMNLHSPYSLLWLTGLALCFLCACSGSRNAVSGNAPTVSPAEALPLGDTAAVSSRNSLSLPQDSSALPLTDSLSVPASDTTGFAADSLDFPDGSAEFSTDSAGFLHQSSTIEDVLDYTAVDSVYVDLNTRIAHLFSEAVVNYSGFHLESDYMEVNLPGSEVLAQPTFDSLGLEVGVPHFEDSKNQFDAKEIRYNFNTKKGIIKDVMTIQEDVYVHGNVVKKYENDVSFIKGARFTSCDLENPHFDLRAFKAKVVPQKAIILGSAMMFIEDVPTPLVLPFAAIPNQKKHRSGILFPSFGQTRRAGFFFKGFGVYLNFNDYFDLKAEADAYTGGNWEIRADFRYAVRYKFSGALNFGYSWIYQDERGLPHRAHQNGFKIQWSHSQDSKARPNSRFSANVNFTNSSYSKYSGNLSDYLTSSTTSNISYSLDFAQKLHLALNASADYNTYTRAFNLTLPTVSLSVDQLYPFRRKKAVGKRRWYETISFNYSLLAQNNIRAFDTNFFSQQTLDNMNNGIKQTARLASTVKIFKYLNWTNSFDYNEMWYLNNTTKGYDPEQNLIDIKNKGFKTTRQFSYNTNLSFNVYGIFKFRKGWIKAFRHVMTPTVGITYRPDFSKPFWGAYATYTDPNGVEHLYSKYANNIYGGPASGMVGSINLSLKNTFDMKVRSKKDTVSGEKKIKLIDNLTVSTSYNMAADSLRWAPITISARTVLFQRLNVNVGASFDFYKADKDGRRYNEFFWVDNKYKGLRFTRTDLSVSLAWNLNPKANPKQNGQTQEKPQHPYYASDLYDPTDIFLQPIDFKAPWNLNIGYNLNYIVTPDARNGKLSHDVVQTITLSGNVKITDRFDINFGTGFDVQAKKFTITTISFSRDLHCWEMGFYWVPFGYRTEWNFHIRVKSGIFQSLKAQKSKSYIDNYY